MAVKGAKNKRAVDIKEKEVVDRVKDMTFDSVTKELAGVQVELQKTLAELSGTLAEQFQLLEDVQKTIALKEQELERLHDIKVTATTLDELKATIEERQEQQEEEEKEFKRKFAEMQGETRKQWARESEDHQYDVKQKNKKQDDALTELHQQKEKANKEKQEQLEKIWKEREDELKKREQELAELRAFKESNDERIKKAINTDVAIATNSLKKEYEHQKQILQMGADTDKKLADAQKAADAQTIAKLHAQVAQLEKAIELAHQRVTDTASKAFESVSQRGTADALQRLMETDKMSGKSSK
jgi:hypothetical protein